MSDLSIVICTYNRSDLLRYCLQSFLEQITSYQFEVIVIDNNSTDHTYQVCKDFMDKDSKFKYVKEVNQGLSYARNRALSEASSEWIAYVDDDAKAHSNYVERALWIIKNYDFDCFGGVFNAWYTIKKPKWLNEEYGTNKTKQSYTGLLDKDYMDGGNMIWKKDVLFILEGFPTDIGMIGNQIGYGEETFIQEKARKYNYKIGFDPALQIDHYVQPYKLNLSWQIKSGYAFGSNYWKTFDRVPSEKDSSILAYQYIFRKFFVDSIRSLPLLLFKKDYYWQNFIIDIFRNYVIEYAKIKSARKLEIKSKVQPDI